MRFPFLITTLAIVASVGLAVSACGETPQETAQRHHMEEVEAKMNGVAVDQYRHNVRLLFEIDGCKVYSFRDDHYYNSHFATCPGIVTDVKPNGKSTKPDDTVTVIKP